MENPDTQLQESLDFFETFKPPKRPKFKFGEPLEEAFQNGALHPGLKDLFLKAYLSARQLQEDDGAVPGRPEEEETAGVLLALKSGASGQGTLSQRISLKTRLEKGEWLVPAQTPRGAPLWLLRHFLGRLPNPLLQGSQWKELGRACGEAAQQQRQRWQRRRQASGPPPQELLERIAASAKELSPAEYSLLGLLTLLIRKFTIETRRRVKDEEEERGGAEGGEEVEEEEDVDEEEEAEEVTNGLSQYFIASITARPFRPGLHTSADKECQPLLGFVSKYWHLIFQEMPAESILDNSPLGFTASGLYEDSYQYFQDDTHNSKSQKLIGFEPLTKSVQEAEPPQQEEKQPIKKVGGVSMIKLFTEMHVDSLRSSLQMKEGRFKLSEFLRSTPPVDQWGSEEDHPESFFSALDTDCEN